MNSAIFSFYQIANFHKVRLRLNNVIKLCTDHNGNLLVNNFFKVAKAAGFESKYIKLDSFDSFDSNTLPITLKNKQGEHFILAGLVGYKYYIVVEGQDSIIELGKEEFEEIYSGEALPMIHLPTMKLNQRKRQLQCIFAVLWQYQNLFRNLFIWKIQQNRATFYVYILLDQK
jgi:ABC-type bacteriocin/lantibiotic exporter with double-glycine peptidase domain